MYLSFSHSLHPRYSLLLLCFDSNILNILCRFQVTADIGAFDELIHCCHRLVDLKRKDLDIEVQNSTMLIFICLQNYYEISWHYALGTYSYYLTMNPKLFTLHIKSRVAVRAKDF